MNTEITSIEFFKHWISTSNELVTDFEAKWNNASDYTYFILNDVLEIITKKCNLSYYNEYYNIDSVFFKNEDLVPNIPENTTWLKHIRIAFEHENKFNSGLYQEISHLLITQCDIRILVTYPEGSDINSELDRLHDIVFQTKLSKDLSDNQSLLIILGKLVDRKTIWTGYIYNAKDWTEISE